ncbi:hypothetical protein Y032_0019g3787 [Ancylostoma ceylanicum]|uniref:Fungal lipase-type domain-containing protein n=1 Tax=Ancylostoma ceylanicum TaxID=53326 RepID=A0A016V2A3_9BILA|nr:hypothetical protein Y032_0019g3787 [Ancylostoma ceylanicum]
MRMGTPCPIREENDRIRVSDGGWVRSGPAVGERQTTDLPWQAVVETIGGTQRPGQLIQQGIDSTIRAWSKWDYGGHISLYFNKTFHTIWQGLEHRVYMYIYEHPDWDIWIGGHSLGGALATLATFFLVHSKLVQPDAVKLMTFGQPRVGDKAFADAFDNEVGYAYRVVHSRDIVPSIPRSGYWHQGAEVIDALICIFISWFF